MSTDTSHRYPIKRLSAPQLSRRPPPALSGRVHGGKKNAPDDSGAITFSGTFSGTLVGARSGAGAGAGVWAGFGTVSGMSIGVEPG
jgi:hypothetical protein